MRFPTYMLLFILLVGSVSALTTYKVEKELTVDFQGEREFTLRTENLDKHFSWGENETPSDKSIDLVFYKEFDFDDMCDVKYTNFTNVADEMRRQCTSFLEFGIENANVTERYLDCMDGKRIVLTERDRYKNESTLCKAELEDTMYWMENYNKSMATAQTDADDMRIAYRNCTATKKICEETKCNWPLHAIIGGIIGGFLARIKPKKKESDKEELYMEG